MTATEMSNEFDVMLNQKLNKADEDVINEYDKSLFLTQAQEAIVLEYSKTPDRNEKIRRLLAEMTKTYTNNSLDFSQSNAIATNNLKSIIVDSLPSNLWVILTEQLRVDNNSLEVVPITYDEFNVIKNNPFRVPNDERVWRLDYNTNESLLELISDTSITSGEYYNRYIEKPSPIITEDLGGLTIDGESTVQNCKLNTSIHREIVDMATNLAIKSLYIESVKQ